MLSYIKQVLVFFAATFFISTEAQANTGLPMIIVVWPTFWLALIPIIIVEWIVMKRVLLGISSKSLFFTATFSNVISTLVGIPLAWLGMILVEAIVPGALGTFPDLNPFFRGVLSVTLQAPWLPPYENALFWMIPAAFLFLMIPFFFMSYWIEGCITSKILNKKPGPSSAECRKAVWKANLYSYLFLSLLIIIVSISQKNYLGDLYSYLPSTISSGISNLASYIAVAGYWLMGINLIWKACLILAITAFFWYGYYNRNRD